MKRCSKCKIEKPDGDYSSKASGYCKPCFREYRKAHVLTPEQKLRLRRSEDADFRKSNDKKTCWACQEQGSETVLFRSWRHGRCVRCEKYSRYRCGKHGLTRKPKCPHCKRDKDRRYRARMKEEPLRRELARVILITGDGRCAECDQLIRHSGKVDRSHRCTSNSE
jgi:hypothetical protein